MDWNKLATGLKDEVLHGLHGLLDGAREDLEVFGTAIAADLVRAAREQREDILVELGNQVRVIAEINRIRVVNASWAQLQSVLTLVGRVAMKAVGAVI